MTKEKFIAWKQLLWPWPDRGVGTGPAGPAAAGPIFRPKKGRFNPKGFVPAIARAHSVTGI